MSVSETALARERAKRCKWCAQGYDLDEVYGHPELPVHMLDSGDVPCTCPSNTDIYEELAKERDELAKAFHNCLGILKIALNGMSGAFVNAVCEEELPRFERLDAIRAAREKEKA